MGFDRAQMSVPLWLLVQSRNEFGDPSLPILTVTSEFGVGLRDLSSGGRAVAEDLSGYRVVRPGDLVVNKMWARFGAYGVSHEAGLISPAYWVLRIDERRAYPGFVHYLLRSDTWRGEIWRRSKDLPPNGFDISWDQFRSLRLDLPPLEEQRRIADFLDEQTALLDRAAGLRQRQLAALSAARIGAAQDFLAGHSLDGPPLSSVARLVDTEHKTAPDGLSGGYFIAGTNAIRNGRLVTQQLREIDAATFDEWTSRTIPRVGDVFLTREAPIGQVALLTDPSRLPAIGQRVVLIRPEPSWTGEYMRLVLMSPVLDRLVSDKAAGSLHPHLNMSDVRRLRVPELTSRLRENLGVQFTVALRIIEEAEAAVMVTLGKLTELKASLITTAVTGDLDVATARRGIAV